MPKYGLIPPIPPGASIEELIDILDSVIIRANSTCHCKVAGTTINFAENVDSVSNPSTGVYTFSLAVTYLSADDFVAIATAEDATDIDVTCTVSATTTSTVTVRVEDIDGNATNVDHLMLYTYGTQA